MRGLQAGDETIFAPLQLGRHRQKPRRFVGHDDLEMYERAQQGLRSNSADWVNVQRLYRPGEETDVIAVENGTTERQMRNQFHAWKKFLLSGMNAQKRGAAA